MLFSSFEFIFFFLPMALVAYYACSRFHNPLWGKVCLLSCSLFFYGWWNTDYLPLLAGSILVNYFISRKIVTTNAKVFPKQRAMFLFAGITFNIVLLGYFKYANFFVDTANALFSQNYFLSQIALPLGISFFTIQQIAFLMDANEEIAEEKNFLDYSLFVTFFPHLLAGPILHHKEMMPQFANTKVRHFDAKNFSIGLFLFSLGLFKKVIVADPLSVWVDAGYELHDTMTFIDAWVTSLGFVFQVYFDFSGYVDMAIGIAWMFNIKLPNNFDSPYRATGVINFWERWHITLSKFITTYIYTPLVKNFPGRITFTKSMIATLVAMLIAGLWHGAAWTYALFGLMHGAGLVVNRIWRKQKKLKMPAWLGWFFTFIFITISFATFRAGNIDSAWIIIKALLGVYNHQAGSWLDFHVISVSSFTQIPYFGAMEYQMTSKLIAMSVIAVLLSVCLFCKNSSGLYERFQPNNWQVLLQVSLIAISLFMMNGVTDFVYFQF
jgi:alginate O-acetyltransferase complex protein AlgI